MVHSLLLLLLNGTVHRRMRAVIVQGQCQSRTLSIEQQIAPEAAVGVDAGGEERRWQ